MAHYTDVRTGTSTGTNSHIIPIMPLMTASASCDRKHVIVMYVPKTNVPLKCTHPAHIHLVHMHILQNYVSINASNKSTAINSVMRNTGTHTFYIIGICP